MYVTASSSMACGVSSAVSTHLADVIPTIPITTETAASRYMPLMMLFSTMSILPAPKCCDTTTPTPADMPKLIAKSRKFREPVAPTDASALAPTNRPTTMESTML